MVVVPVPVILEVVVQDTVPLRPRFFTVVTAQVTEPLPVKFKVS